MNRNKVHGWNNVSLRMIQLCGNSISKPIKYLFESSSTAGILQEGWKKGNIIPVHKKESKNCLKSYRPISLFPVFSKIFERQIFNARLIFNFFCSESVA